MIFVIVLKYNMLLQIYMLLNLVYPIVFKSKSLMVHYSNIINNLFNQQDTRRMRTYIATQGTDLKLDFLSLIFLLLLSCTL